MGRETTVGQYYRVDDADLPWVYARSGDSGGIFGLEMQSLLSAINSTNLISVAYAPHAYKIMGRTGGNVIHEPEEIEYAASHGDGTSHGATWRNFSEMLKPLASKYFPKLDNRTVELHLDGLQSMALEGANRNGGGWTVIHEGLVNARDDLHDKGHLHLRGPIFQGLGWLAANFAEREEAAMPSLAV